MDAGDELYPDEVTSGLDFEEPDEDEKPETVETRRRAEALRASSALYTGPRILPRRRVRGGRR